MRHASNKPQRIIFAAGWASKSHAAKETATPNHWDCPSREGDLSFYNQLWCNNDDLLDAAYRTSFVQGMNLLGCFLDRFWN